MTKIEFLNKLKAELVSNVSNETLQDNLAYYDSYINDGVTSGRSEEDVIADLGDYRLIAKTIIDAEDGDEYKSARDRFEQFTYHNFRSQDSESESQKQQEPKRRAINLGGWKVKLIIAAIIFVFIVVIFSIFKVTLSLLVWFFTRPVIWIVIIGLFIYRKWFRT